MSPETDLEEKLAQCQNVIARMTENKALSMIIEWHDTK